MPSPRMTSATAEISASVFRALSLVRTDSSVRSGTMPEKILTCLTCPAMTACDDAGRLENLDTLAEMAERDPVELGARAIGAACSSSGNASSLTATTVTSWPRLRAPCSARNGNLPLPAIRPILLMQAGSVEPRRAVHRRPPIAGPVVSRRVRLQPDLLTGQTVSQFVSLSKYNRRFGCLEEPACCRRPMFQGD